MSPAVKYTLGRFGLFVVVFAALFPTPLNILVKAMIAFVASAGFAFFLLRKWRDEMAEQLGSAAQRRSAEKARLRSALAGDDDAAEAGDRVAAADAKNEAAADVTDAAAADVKEAAAADVKGEAPADVKDEGAAAGEQEAEKKSEAGK